MISDTELISILKLIPIDSKSNSGNNLFSSSFAGKFSKEQSRPSVPEWQDFSWTVRGTKQWRNQGVWNEEHPGKDPEKIEKEMRKKKKKKTTETKQKFYKIAWRALLRIF